MTDPSVGAPRNQSFSEVTNQVLRPSNRFCTANSLRIRIWNVTGVWPKLATKRREGPSAKSRPLKGPIWASAPLSPVDSCYR